MPINAVFVVQIDKVMLYIIIPLFRGNTVYEEDYAIYYKKNLLQKNTMISRSGLLMPLEHNKIRIDSIYRNIQRKS